MDAVVAVDSAAPSDGPVTVREPPPADRPASVNKPVSVNKPASAGKSTHTRKPVSVREPAPPGGQTPGLHDEVDEIVAGWHAERPDVDLEPLHVLSRVSRLARHLDRARRAAFAAHGLETWEFDVLSALRRQGAPYQLSPGALLRATLVTSGTMTNRIDRLTEAGLVIRYPDPLDKRGVLVTLTERGREVADAALVDLLDHERAMLGALDSAQREMLAGLLRMLLGPFDDHQHR
jgi:DNA-binding MarR family transcriptional regulator